MALLTKRASAPQLDGHVVQASGLRGQDLAVAAAGLAAVLLIVLDIGGPGPATFKLLVCLVLPGWVAVSRLPGIEPAARAVYTVAASAVLFAVLAVVMVWVESWHPRPVAAAVLLAAVITQLFLSGPGGPPRFSLRRGADPRHRRSPGNDPGPFIQWLVLAAAIILWITGLTQSRHQQLDGFGLLRVFPVSWYLGVGAATGLCIWGVAARTMFPRRIMVAGTTALVLMLYSSATILAEVPRLPWVYKHIAVTDYIGAVGHVSPGLDIYNRWPGFFSLSAFLGEVMGYRDAVDYAAWAETGFALVDTVLVLAIARSISKSARIYWTATLVFIVTNYVNQNYYAPQAFSYSLYLAMCLAALTFLRGLPARWIVYLEQRVVLSSWLARIRGQEPAGLATQWVHTGAAGSRVLGIAGVLVLQTVMVFSHQLSPYLAALGLLPLFLFGYFRPRWLGPVLLGVALVYLIPNLAYIRTKYGLFSGWNFFKNTGYKAGPSDPIILGQWTLTGNTLAHGAVVLTALTGILAMAGFVRRILRGHIRTTAVVAWLAFAPVLSLLGQSYGGEARFRVYLFALPWLAIGVAWLFWAAPVRSKRSARGATVSLFLMAMLFTVVYFQPEADYRVSKADVTAGQWLDSNVRKGDMVFETNYFFPLLIGPNYPHYLTGGHASSLSDYLKESNGEISVPGVMKYARQIQEPNRTFIVLSDGQRKRAVRRDLFDPEYLKILERKLVKAENVATVFDNGAVRIYQINR